MPRYPRVNSTPITSQIVPRSSGRFDRPVLPLADAGHGSAPDTSNPLLWGLGAQVHLQLDAYASGFSARVEAPHPSTGALTSESVTNLFRAHPTIARRYVMAGVIGLFPLALAAHQRSDFTARAIVVTLVVSVQGGALSKDLRHELVIRASDGVAACEAAEACDLTLLSALSRGGVRVFPDIVNRTAAANVAVSFLFAQLDHLLSRVPGLSAALPNYSAQGTVGVEFGSDGRCGAQNPGATPACPSTVCCCSLDIAGSTITASDITTPALNPLSVGGSAGVNQFDVVELRVVVRARGSGNCAGFDALTITLPGLDTTGGRWALLDTLQAPGYPTVLINGAPVAAVFTQAGVVGGNGTGVSGVLNLSGIVVACGAELDLRFRVQAQILTVRPTGVGLVAFNDLSGPCFVHNVTRVLPLFFVSQGMDHPIPPPADPPV